MSLQSKCWYLDQPRNQSRLDWDELGGRRNAKHVCQENPSHNSTGKRLGDLHLVLPSTAIQDFVWTWSSDCLVGDKALQGFQAQGFTGLEARPVHLRWEQPSDQPLPKLWELQVTGWAGMAPPESGIRRLERCAVCGRQVYTGFTNPELLIDKKQWDGSDFFIVWPMPRYIFITERVASFILTEGMTGAEIVDPDQMSRPKLVKTLTPLPLRDWFPEDRARKLGEPLDIY